MRIGYRWLFQVRSQLIESENISCISSVQSLTCVQLFVTPWTAARQVSLSITNPWSLLKLMSIESVKPSNHLILCRPLLLLPSTFPSIRVFAKESEFAYLPPNLESPLSYPRPVLLLVSYRVDQWESSCS